MAKRVNLPAADELFRATEAPEGGQKPASSGSDASGTSGPGRPSGRVRHDEKMTIYVTADELLAIEQARLTLRSQHGLAVDRGRLVRQAVALALGDLAESGEESELVRKLRDQ